MNGYDHDAANAAAQGSAGAAGSPPRQCRSLARDTTEDRTPRMTFYLYVVCGLERLSAKILEYSNSVRFPGRGV